MRTLNHTPPPQVGTGKTSLVRQYVHHTFTNNYKSTIGVCPPARPPPPDSPSPATLLTVGPGPLYKALTSR